MTERIIAREAEVASLDRFLGDIPRGPCSLLLTGEEGIGKTTLWKEALGMGLQRGIRVLACRPVQSEVKLSFTALADLFNGVFDDSGGEVPAPQRSALGAALLRDEPGAH